MRTVHGSILILCAVALGCVPKPSGKTSAKASANSSANVGDAGDRTVAGCPLLSHRPVGGTRTAACVWYHDRARHYGRQCNCYPVALPTLGPACAQGEVAEPEYFTPEKVCDYRSLKAAPWTVVELNFAGGDAEQEKYSQGELDNMCEQECRKAAETLRGQSAFDGAVFVRQYEAMCCERISPEPLDQGGNTDSSVE